MTFILTNDDGINAEGINALQKIITEPLTIVAPNRQYSGCAHQVTVRKPIVVEQKEENAYSVDGTPADCVRLAIKELCPQGKWILSGINAGGNLGLDIYMSGTVGAVREAAVHGLSAIAFSQVIKYPSPINWDWTMANTKRVLDLLLSKELDRGCFWNVNLPPLDDYQAKPEIIFCSPSIDPLPVKYLKEGDAYRYCGGYHERKVTNGTDVDVCFSGNIAVSMISL